MERLISMTDFVLEQSKLNGYDINDSDWIERVVNYANFLKQPLKLEMFIPVDEDGNILYEPKQTSLTCSFFEQQQFFNKQKKYEKAKEKVLFNGFDDIEAINYHISRNRNIEYLSKFGTLELTENAIKTFK